MVGWVALSGGRLRQVLQPHALRLQGVHNIDAGLVPEACSRPHGIDMDSILRMPDAFVQHCLNSEWVDGQLVVGSRDGWLLGGEDGRMLGFLDGKDK
eukprot:193506-Chlamydomonas_euryale.AAC.4